jgi:plasmid maintenance system antidote protein VapI
MRKKASDPKEPISRALRKTIRERGLTAYATARQAGVSVDAIQRFLKQERGLTLATVDKLSVALELTLCAEESPDDRDTPAAKS